jgi:hypothetical protein
VHIVFRVCEIADERDWFYFTHRDLGGGRNLIKMRECLCYNEVSCFSLQPWFKSIEQNPRISLSGRLLASQIKFDLVRSWVSCLKIAKNTNTTPLPIKLIDTLDGKLIDADISFRYVALSYVWGGYK